jgi:outer membrane protein
MKYINWGLNIFFFLALTFLYFLHFRNVQKNKNDDFEIVTPNDSIKFAGGVSIAYINTDSVVANYKYYTELKTKLENEQRVAENQLQIKAKDLEHEYKLLSTKVNLGLIKQEEAERSFAVKQQEVELLRQNLSDGLINKERELTEQLYDSIVTFVNKYNLKSRHTYILGYAKGGGIIYAPKSMDMTKQIVKGLNDEYINRSKK